MMQALSYELSWLLLVAKTAVNEPTLAYHSIIYIQFEDNKFTQ
jgi:hypothetical protein